MLKTKKRVVNIKSLSSSERRAVRAEHIRVEDADPCGWMAYSEADAEQIYHLFCDPETRRLVCTCADFIFRGDAEQFYECKHISATLKHIARSYLSNSYDARAQNDFRAA
jgi:hypothetical protein